MGCFWGAERIFWNLKGVYVTSVGYAGGFTPNPTYEEVCSGNTNHAEVVKLEFDPIKISYEEAAKFVEKAVWGKLMFGKIGLGENTFLGEPLFLKCSTTARALGGVPGGPRIAS